MLTIGLSIIVLAVSGCGTESKAPDEDGSDVEQQADLTDSDSDAGASRSLIDHSLWEWAADTDPIGDAPAEVSCPEASWAEEVNVLDIDTEGCNFLSLTQPSLSAVHAGETVEVFVTHDPLWAEQPAEAHVAVALEEEVIWEETIPIPSASGLLNGEWVATRDIPAGATVRLHLHNHGTNSWSLVDITATP